MRILTWRPEIHKFKSFRISKISHLNRCPLELFFKSHIFCLKPSYLDKELKAVFLISNLTYKYYFQNMKNIAINFIEGNTIYPGNKKIRNRLFSKINIHILLKWFWNVTEFSNCSEKPPYFTFINNWTFLKYSGSS